MSDIDITDCVFDPPTLMADLAYDLARQAHSCLHCTPTGLPGRGFYVWTGPPEPSCCDEVAVWMQRMQTYKGSVFGPEVLNEPIFNGECGEIGWAAELVITLMRPCRRILDEGGTPTNATSRNVYGHNLLIDAQTITCCVEQALQFGELAGKPEGFWAERFWWRPVYMEDAAHCTRVSFPLVVNLGNCCTEPWE